MRDFTFYIDDSGTKDYAAPGQEYGTAGGVTPYFVFGGLILGQRAAGEAHHKLRLLKQACFGRKNVEIKANWLRYGKERRARYLDRFQLSEEDVRDFVDKVYELILGTECILLACAIDKQAVQERYATPHYAPAIAYDFMLQRAQMQMHQRNGYVRIVMDDMAGATPHGNQYKDNLRRQHERLRTHGSPLMPGFHYDRIGGLKFSDSRSDERIQLADLVAYNVYRQFIEHGEDWDRDSESLSTYEYLRRLAPRFCQDKNGRIAGYGIVKFPQIGKRRWGIPT
ncbi:MAG: DUF3800 domain-containing protein [Candidatus Hydrogenedentes bacterium]|nr:DUF3800 domain-containing protein [Candidatus Hydrogenedentota bacterium]